MKKWGMSPTSAYKPAKPIYNGKHQVFHIHRKKWTTGSCTSAFLDIEEASDSIPHDITHVTKCHGLGDTL